MKQRGDQFEQQAVRFLQRQGLDIVARNYRCKLGEIDIIALDRGNLVFVEVRARCHRSYAGAAASVDFHKQRRLIAAAHIFLQRHPKLAQCTCRFDVIAFEPRQSQPELHCDWIKSAFIA